MEEHGLDLLVHVILVEQYDTLQLLLNRLQILDFISYFFPVFNLDVIHFNTVLIFQFSKFLCNFIR